MQFVMCGKYEDTRGSRKGSAPEGAAPVYIMTCQGCDIIKKLFSFQRTYACWVYMPAWFAWVMTGGLHGFACMHACMRGQFVHSLAGVDLCVLFDMQLCRAASMLALHTFMACNML